ncbi:MAG: zinc-dependent alcohol dehydrogenase [Nocardioidaceae bacterium]
MSEGDMQALVFHGPWDLRVEQVGVPEPGPGDVLIRVQATGICGSDVHGFSGENGRRHPGQVMGHETVGLVDDIGDDVNPALGLRPGSTVTVNPVLACGRCRGCESGYAPGCTGRRIIGVTPDIVSAFAEYLVCPADNVVPLAGGIPIEYGALVEPLSVGYHAARRGGCAGTDTVLVIGGGPIGQAAVLAARRLGVDRLAVTEPNPTRRELAGALGAVPVDPGSAEAADRVTDALGGPATLVLDAVGSSASLADAVRFTAPSARIVLVGMNAPRIELAGYAISTEERTLIGSFCYTADEFRDTAQWVASAPPGLSRLIDGHVGLHGAPRVFAELAGGQSEASKVLVHPHGYNAATSPPPANDA